MPILNRVQNCLSLHTRYFWPRLMQYKVRILVQNLVLSFAFPPTYTHESRPCADLRGGRLARHRRDDSLPVPPSQLSFFARPTVPSLPDCTPPCQQRRVLHGMAALLHSVPAAPSPSCSWDVWYRTQYVTSTSRPPSMSWNYLRTSSWCVSCLSVAPLVAHMLTRALRHLSSLPRDVETTTMAT